MGTATSIMVYLIAWWMVFFMSLPIGVDPQDKDGGEVVPGTPSSAPKKPKLLMKMGIATIGGGVLWAIIYYTIEWGLIDVRPPAVAS